METSPLISIITVVYNGAKTIEQTILSVLNQTYKNIEYIIIDGGSTDGTQSIIEKYKNSIAIYVREQDNGLYDAMNKGIKLASGELIGMINSDDWYEPNAVELVVEAYYKNPIKKIFHGDRYDVLEDRTKQLRKFHPSKMKFLYYGMTYNHPSMFIHREIYKKNRYNPTLKALSDYEFVLKEYLINKSVFHHIPIAYVNFRLEGISARMKLVDRLKEGHVARKNANMSNSMIMISLLTRILIFTLYKKNTRQIISKF